MQYNFNHRYYNVIIVQCVFEIGGNFSGII